MNPFKSVTQRLKRILWFLVFSVVTRHASLAVEGAYGQTLSPMTEFPEPFAGLEAAGRAKWAASLPDESKKPSVPFSLRGQAAFDREQGEFCYTEDTSPTTCRSFASDKGTCFRLTPSARK